MSALGKGPRIFRSIEAMLEQVPDEKRPQVLELLGPGGPPATELEYATAPYGVRATTIKDFRRAMARQNGATA